MLQVCHSRAGGVIGRSSYHGKGYTLTPKCEGAGGGQETQLPFPSHAMGSPEEANDVLCCKTRELEGSGLEEYSK